jgi:gas vesicle protein
MKTPDAEPTETTATQVDVAPTAHGRAGFLAGIVFGAFLGAGLALLFAPERGGKTRDRLRRRMRELQSDAADTLDQAGTRTRKELSRRKRRLKLELERLRERARERAREAKDALD